MRLKLRWDIVLLESIQFNSEETITFVDAINTKIWEASVWEAAGALTCYRKGNSHSFCIVHRSYKHVLRGYRVIKGVIIGTARYLPGKGVTG